MACKLCGSDNYVSPKEKVSAYCSECNKEICKKYYWNHRDKMIERQKAYLKKTNYACEKTKEQRIIRHIKRETRRRYPLKDNKCQFCDDKATEHHHYTSPIEIHKFYFVCHNCHLNKVKLLGKEELNNTGGIQNGNTN